MEVVTKLTVLAAVVLAFSFVIERTLEVMKAAYDLIDSKYDLCHFWTARATKTRDYLEARLRVFEYVEPRIAASFLARFDAYILGADTKNQGTVPVLCGDLVRGSTIKVIAKVIGMLLGLALAIPFDLDIFRISSGAVSIDHRLGIAVTGIAMGLGSSLVHKAIVALERKRDGKGFVEVPSAANG